MVITAEVCCRTKYDTGKDANTFELLCIHIRSDQKELERIGGTVKSIRRVKKAYKVYGKDKGYLFLTLLYSYWYKTRNFREENQERNLEAFRTEFSRYILQKYGREISDEYWVFHLNNENNVRLIKKLDKKKSIFLDDDILELVLEKPMGNMSERKNAVRLKQVSRRKRKLFSSDSREDEHSTIHKVGKKPERRDRASTVAAKRKETYNSNIGRYELNYVLDDTPGKIYSSLPARNIDYIPYSPAKRSFKFTMKRLYDGSEYIEYHSGKDMNEAMAIVNRISFDKARIIKVEEEVRNN